MDLVIFDVMLIFEKTISKADLAPILPSDICGKVANHVSLLRRTLKAWKSPCLYYVTTISVIAAMGWFIAEAFERFGAGGIFMVSATYAFWFTLAARGGWLNEILHDPKEVRL
jgi:hypothetical protein